MVILQVWDLFVLRSARSNASTTDKLQAPEKKKSTYTHYYWERVPKEKFALTTAQKDQEAAMKNLGKNSIEAYQYVHNFGSDSIDEYVGTLCEIGDDVIIIRKRITVEYINPDDPFRVIESER